jgi:Cys-rich protein (TIGR01571 family)
MDTRKGPTSGSSPTRSGAIDSTANPMYVSANSGSAGGFKSGAGAAADEEIHAGIVLSDVENARMNPKSPTNPASSSSTSVVVVPPTGITFNSNTAQIMNQQQPVGGTPNTVQDWNSQMFDCSRDEESSWWGCWCCWLVGARTVETFELGKSIQEVILFWVGMVVFLILFVLQIQPLGLFWGLGIFGYFIWRRANYRYAIRAKYNIPGHFSDDVLAHTACICCAVCQESREAKLRLLPRLDYCFGDSLAEQEMIHDRALGRANSALTENLVPESGNILSHLQAVSKTSRLIVVLSAVVCFLSFVVLIGMGRAYNILVLLLVFVQPLAILYFVYWRSRRQYALLDFVIKTFAVGFWFTTFQSVVLESILQVLLFIIMTPLMTYGEKTDPNSPGPPPLPNEHNHDVAAAATAATWQGNKGTLAKFVFQLMNGYVSVSNGYGSDAYTGYDNMYPNDAPSSSPSTDDLTDTEHQKHLMRTHFIIVLITLFIMAYVVAAGVEETMKHFIVRCCQFPGPLRDPHAVLVYLMAGALGFATCENIEYVFGQKSSPFPGTTMFEGELLLLLMRVLMPIHVICSVLQAANLSKVIIGEQHMSLFQVSIDLVYHIQGFTRLTYVCDGILQILAPALLLHGTFDFILFLLATIGYIYGGRSAGFEISSLVISMALTVGGAYWAYKSFTTVLQRYDNGWQQVDNVDNAVL